MTIDAKWNDLEPAMSTCDVQTYDLLCLDAVPTNARRDCRRLGGEHSASLSFLRHAAILAGVPVDHATDRIAGYAAKLEVCQSLASCRDARRATHARLVFVQPRLDLAAA